MRHDQHAEQHNLKECKKGNLSHWNKGRSLEFRSKRKVCPAMDKPFDKEAIVETDDHTSSLIRVVRSRPPLRPRHGIQPGIPGLAAGGGGQARAAVRRYHHSG